MIFFISTEILDSMNKSKYKLGEGEKKKKRKLKGRMLVYLLQTRQTYKSRIW